MRSCGSLEQALLYCDVSCMLLSVAWLGLGSGLGLGLGSGSESGVGLRLGVGLEVLERCLVQLEERLLR